MTNDVIRVAQSPRLSKAVKAGDFIFLLGLTSSDRTGDVSQQTFNILRQIDDLLATLGGAKIDLVSATIWMKDIAQFAAMNTAWETWLAGVEPPARATVEAKMESSDILVEVMAQAFVG